ncbi:MAG: hypothetical protein AAGA08_13565 [Pseudomonadota bacterium]
MNKRLAIEEYGYQDFLLIKAPQSEVIDAVCAVTLETDMQPEAQPAPSSRAGGMMKALLKRMPLSKALRKAEEIDPEQAPNGETQKPFTLHRGDAALLADLLTTERGPSYLDKSQPHERMAYFDDVRVSAIDGSDWVLVEYREFVSGISLLGYGLSTKLQGRDVLYFRRSGDLISEYHNDFHVYQDGETLRRVLCHSTWPEGDIQQEWWENTLDGQMTTYEPDDLYQNAGEMDLLDNAMLESILAKLELSSQKLFSRVLTRDPVLISRRPGGEPLSRLD